MNRKHVIAAVVLLVVAAGVLIVSSLGLVDGKRNAQATAQGTSTTSGAPGTSAPAPEIGPLTGLPMPDAALRSRPAVVVKIDNAPEARPQWGIDKADVVVEEKVEGGVSRFMAIYQSQDATSVGPVRSLRSTDVYALRPLGGAVLGYSGGIGPFKSLLPSSNLVDASHDAHHKFYSRTPGRPFVHSLSTSTARLREVTPSNLGAPRPLFDYSAPGTPFAAAGATNVSSVSGRMGPSNQFDWTWDAAAATWRKGTDGKKHNLTNGQISAKNVIIQYVPYRATQYVDPARNPVDEAALDGTGDSWVLSDGKLVAGRWVRPNLSDRTVYNDAAGQPIKLQPGTTWVVLIPAGNSVTVNQ